MENKYYKVLNLKTKETMIWVGPLEYLPIHYELVIEV